MFKVSKHLSPEMANELFKFTEQIPYELRQSYQFLFIHLDFSGTDSFKFLGLKISALVPNEMKQKV